MENRKQANIFCDLLYDLVQQYFELSREDTYLFVISFIRKMKENDLRIIKMKKRDK